VQKPHCLRLDHHHWRRVLLRDRRDGDGVGGQAGAENGARGI